MRTFAALLENSQIAQILFTVIVFRVPTLPHRGNEQALLIGKYREGRNMTFISKETKIKKESKETKMNKESKVIKMEKDSKVIKIEKESKETKIKHES